MSFRVYNLEERIAKHETGEIEGYTLTRLPVRVVFSEEFPTREEALAASNSELLVSSDLFRI